MEYGDFECVYVNPKSVFALAKLRGGGGCDLALVLPEKISPDCPRITGDEARQLIDKMTNDSTPSCKPLFLASIEERS